MYIPKRLPCQLTLSVDKGSGGRFPAIDVHVFLPTSDLWLIICERDKEPELALFVSEYMIVLLRRV